ncbi:MAG: hypothetical protein FD169_1921 [Bacillota bacterium]|nr:MAG: hypothetical protein FD169_1921 [Bacillota bacterium]
MKLLDWNKVTTYTPSDYNGNLMLAEWKAGQCTVDPSATATQTNEMSTTAIVKTLSIQELLSSELLDTTPEEVTELFLLCQDDAATAFAGYRSKLSYELESVEASIAWVANAFFYFRENDQVQTGTVNMLSGNVVPGMEHLLKKYPLTSHGQQPQAQLNISLAQGLKVVIEQGLTSRRDDPASLQCLLLYRSTVTTHAPGEGEMQKKQYRIEKTEAGNMELPTPHLVSSAVIFTPLLLYPLKNTEQYIVYDPTIGRLYLSDVNVEQI